MREAKHKDELGEGKEKEEIYILLSLSTEAASLSPLTFCHREREENEETEIITNTLSGLNSLFHT